MTIGLSSSGYSSECRRVEGKEDREEQVEVEREKRVKEVCAMDGMVMVVKRLRT